ncbi:MAG: choice-of-anchor Q domain-containing protein [Methylococcales bacterium]
MTSGLLEEYDFTLKTNSPAIDAGIDRGQTRDFLGHPISGEPDIGAIEY